MDILGLRNLSAIEDSLPLIKQNHQMNLDIDNIPTGDEPTYPDAAKPRHRWLFPGGVAGNARAVGPAPARDLR